MKNLLRSGLRLEVFFNESRRELARKAYLCLMIFNWTAFSLNASARVHGGWEQGFGDSGRSLAVESSLVMSR